MATPNEIAVKHGYADSLAAIRAIKKAEGWLKKNKGKPMPIHIQRAINVLTDFRKDEIERLAFVKKQLSRLSRQPRYFFGVVPNGSRFERARRFLRRVFKRYLGLEEMAAHFAQLLPPSSKQHFAQCPQEDQEAIMASFIPGIDLVYGLSETSPNAKEIARAVAFLALTR